MKSLEDSRRALPSGQSILRACRFVPFQFLEAQSHLRCRCLHRRLAIGCWWMTSDLLGCSDYAVTRENDQSLNRRRSQFFCLCQARRSVFPQSPHPHPLARVEQTTQSVAYDLLGGAEGVEKIVSPHREDITVRLLLVAHYCQLPSVSDAPETSQSVVLASGPGKLGEYQ